MEVARPGWVVMWSPWRRTLTAFCAFSASAPVVLDAASAEELLRLMDAAGAHLWRSRGAAGGSSASVAWAGDR
ncbi:hypothetical protein [Actinomadura roseirufa]|uniref:hypothetical protein n=1 Tax=Actinomadura roseirufa TaxID=2094049 RepID=UPI0010418AFC|nr:hypothetical protein [Actinomadura roseirufa]